MAEHNNGERGKDFGRRGGSDRPYGDRPARQGDRPYGDRNRDDRRRDDRAPRSFGDRDSRSGSRNFGERPARQGDRPYGDRNRDDRGRDDRAPRSFGDRDNRGGSRNFSDRKPQGDRPYGDRNRDDRGRDDRAPRSFGDRDNRDSRGGSRNFGDRPARQGDRPYGDRKPQGDRPYGDRNRDDHGRDDRAPRSFGDRDNRGGSRNFGDRPARQGDRPYGDRNRDDRGRDDRAPRSFGDRDNRGGSRNFGDRPARQGDRPYGDRKPQGDRPYGDRNRDDRGRDDRAPRSFGDRDNRGGSRNFGDRPARQGDRPYGDRKPQGDRPYGDRNRDDRKRDDRAPRSFEGRDGREREERPAPTRNAADLRSSNRPDRDRSPEIDPDVTGAELDKVTRAQLRILDTRNNEWVSKHLVMAGRLIDFDPELAFEHALAASRRGGRLACVREAVAMTAYAAGNYSEALRELRTYRRISGSNVHLPLMADCERGMGRPDKALDLVQSEEAATLDTAGKIELAIVESGARGDLGELDAALAALEVPQLDINRAFSFSPRLFRAYAMVLRAADRKEEAKKWEDQAVVAEEALGLEDTTDSIIVDLGADEDEYGVELESPRTRVKDVMDAPSAPATAEAELSETAEASYEVNADDAESDAFISDDAESDEDSIDDALDAAELNESSDSEESRTED